MSRLARLPAFLAAGDTGSEFWVAYEAGKKHARSLECPHAGLERLSSKCRKLGKMMEAPATGTGGMAQRG